MSGKDTIFLAISCWLLAISFWSVAAVIRLPPLGGPGGLKPPRFFFRNRVIFVCTDVGDTVARAAENVGGDA